MSTTTTAQDNPRSYQPGEGPVEQLWLRCHTGEITLETAETLAAEPDFLRTLHLTYLRGLANECVAWAQNGRWKHALEMQALVRAALRRLPGLEHAPLSVRADLAVYEIELASLTLPPLPDAARYHSAIQAGDALAAEARTTGAGDVESRALDNLGLLIVNAYLQFPINAGYRRRIDQWRQSPESGEPMPDTEETLSLGIDYLRRASALRSGAARGRSLSKLAPLLIGQATLQQPRSPDGQPTPSLPRHDEAVQIAREALSLLDADSVQDRLDLLDLLRAQGQRLALSDLESVLELDVDAVCARLGVFALDALATLVNLVAPLDVERAIDLTEKAFTVYKRLPQEGPFLKLCRTHVGLLHARMDANPAWTAFAARDVPVLDVTAQLRRVAREQAWPQDMLANAWFALAWRAAQGDEPATALPLIEEGKRAAPAFFESFEPTLTTFEADVWAAVVRSLARRDEWSDMIAAISAAVDRYLRVNAIAPARELLEIMQGLVALVPHPMEAVHAVAKSALDLELKAGAAATAALQEIVKRCLARISGRRFDKDDYLAALHVAKGLRFATALSSPGMPRPTDRQLAGLLERIAQADRDAGSEGVAEPEVNERDLDPRSLAFFVDALSLWGQTELVPASRDETEASKEPVREADTEFSRFVKDLGIAYSRRFTLTAYASEGESEAGATAAERLTNLQRRFDRLSDARLVSSAHDQPTPLTETELQSLLDERSVLLDLYVGRSNEQPTSVGVYSMLATNNGFRAQVQKTRFSEGSMMMDPRMTHIRATAMALRVEQARMGVMRATAGRRVVDRDAEAQLERDLQDFLGDLVDLLGTLRAQGKDHLCIVPHGPLHYYPLHLLGPVGRALADEWIVTYLPNLHSLRHVRVIAGHPRRTERFAGLGLGFANTQPHGLMPLPSSIEELEAVSGVFGVQPLRNEAATEAAFLDALMRYRYVHVSTHGSHNADAPSFQVVYLAPEPGSDGRLHVHELTDVDMRGLEILSLSACETALGRFDAADNLRGLPARCFLAGAQTIISTLWEANADASKLFFTTFYECLHEGASKLDAFARAQQHTRRAYPKYADWSAFCFMGDWRQSTQS